MNDFVKLTAAEELECQNLQGQVAKFEEVQNAAHGIQNSTTGYEIDITILQLP